MSNWFQITDKKMVIILGIALLWIISGHLLYIFIGSKHGPNGGLDSIGNAIAYVFLWRIIIYIPPTLLTIISFGLWLYQNHRKAILWVVLAIIICIIAAVSYDKYFKRKINTPQRVASHINSYSEWKKRAFGSAIGEKWTESDNICEYVKDIISEAIVEFNTMYSPEEIEVKKSYIDAAMETHYKEIPHVEGWEYIPDIRALIPARSDGDEKFLLNNHELCLVARHYHRTLRREHWYDKYQFKSSFVAEWYSWLPMFVILYDDETIDIVIVS